MQFLFFEGFNKILLCLYMDQVVNNFILIQVFPDKVNIIISIFEIEDP